MAVAGLAGLAGLTSASYAHELGHTTEDHRVVAGPRTNGYAPLVEAPGSPRVVRTLGTAAPLAGRSGRRGSLSYFAQLTDFQLADEESPARVEFADQSPPGASAWRPQEAFHPNVIDWSFRQLNQFTAASPHTQAGGRRAAMEFGLLTGDQSDNQQYNETLWVRQLVEGGQMLDPNSGKAAEYNRCTAAQQALLDPAEAPRYTGVQDYSDYNAGAGDSRFYDPNRPTGRYANFPEYEGLMDRAQKPFVPVGLRRGNDPVPTYVTNGNHDGLVQGNEDAIKAYEDIAVGCFKPFAATNPGGAPAPDPDPNPLLGLSTGFAVPPDDERRFVDRIELKGIYRGGTQGDDHGFAFIDPVQNAGSGFAASYYAWDPKPGVRFISVDTVSDGGVVNDSSNGNIDEPQFRWLEDEVRRADAAGKLIVLFGHHPIRSLTSSAPDEAAAPCTGRYESETPGKYGGPAAQKDGHGHDQNPGCDLDPRSSQPVHQGGDLVNLLSAHDNVLAYVAGHTHENKVLACGRPEGCPRGGNWWEVNTSATADFPQQHRLIELMDNDDGTLSIFGTTLDHGAKLGIPPATSTKATVDAFDNETLASLGRSFSFNDDQADAPSDTGQLVRFGAEGAPQDRNVELVVDDPRTNMIRGTPGNDVIVGTPGNDVIICGAGNDIVRAGDGNDIVRCGRGNDFVDAGRGNDRVSGDQDRDRLLGQQGNDRVYGRSGHDRIFGSSGADRLYGGSGLDRFSGGSGNDRLGGSSGNDRINAGSGRDVVSASSGKDRVAGGSGGDRIAGGSSGDRLAGQAGNDRISGDSGNDRLYGGSGNDRLRGGRGRDRIAGGPGRDRKRR